MTALRIAILVGFAVAPVGVSRADKPPTAATLYLDGEAKFRAGNIEDAIESFSRGYALEPRAEFLLNLAQCYRALGRRTEAIQHLERFIRAAPDHALRGNAERTLDELRRAEAIERVALTPQVARPAPVPASPPRTDAASSSRTWIWVTAGAAAVLLGGGVAIYVATRGPSVDDTIRLPPP